MAKIQNTGLVACSKLRDTITSQLMVDITLDNGVKQLPLTMARNLAHDPDKKILKNAYECELKAYEKIEDSLAAC